MADAPVQRDRVRANRATVLKTARDHGVNVDDMQQAGETITSLAHRAGALVNDGVPRPTRYSLQVDDPVIGAIDGINTEFFLTQRALSTLNTIIVFMHASPPSLEVLSKTNAPAPAGGSVFIDLPQRIRVGDAPQAGDKIIAVYNAVN